MTWYSTTAPGIRLGLVVPLTGSETTVVSLTTVSGTVLLLSQVQLTEPSTGIVMVRDRPEPDTTIVLRSLVLLHARFIV